MLRAAESPKSAADSLPLLSYAAAPPHVSSRPPIPHHLERIQLQENAKIVLEKRFLRRGESGAPVEGVDDMFWRVAWHVGVGQPALAEEFYRLMTSKRFFPNSPTFTGSSTPLGQMAACFVLPISDDMGRASDGIFQTLRDATLVQQTGGGNGFSFSRLRQKGAFVKTSGGSSSGPVGFLKVYDAAFGTVAQGGCLLPETLVNTDRGLLRLDEIIPSSLSEGEWAEHSLVVPTDDGPRPSPRSYNNGTAPCLRVQTKEGYEIAGTYEHRIKRFNSFTGEYEWIMLKDVRCGDSLVMLLDQHDGDVAAPLQRPPLVVHGSGIIPERFPGTLDAELAFFLGYFVGNGWMNSGPGGHRIGVTVPDSSTFMHDRIVSLLKIFFGDSLHISVWKPKENASTNYVVSNKLIWNFFEINGFSKERSTSAVIPPLIRRSGRPILASFIRGLFEADGFVDRGCPGLSTTSERLAREVQAALTGLGCISTVRIYACNKGTNLGAQYTNPAIKVRVISSRGLRNWKNNIGIPHRDSRFSVCMGRVPGQGESTDAIPGAMFWLDDHQHNPSFKSRIAKYKSGKCRLTHIAACRMGLRDVIDRIGNRFFTTVTRVDDIGDHPTLDLEVEDNHTYLANGFVGHNTRRGANMAVLRVDHPDIREFATCKTSEDAITNFNISVGITDVFMHAVKHDLPFQLVSPHTNQVIEETRARELWELIVKQATRNGEPGILFLDAANRANPVPHLYELEATNPCGEQWLGPYENCCLGSINLAQHTGVDGTVDWPKLRVTIKQSMRFLDNVVEVNAYVPSVPQLREAAMRCRRVGLGIMGLADLMYHCRVAYGSEEGEEFASQLMEFVRYHAMAESIQMAAERGPFPAIEGSIYDDKQPGGMRWTAPSPLRPYQRDFGRPELDWPSIVAALKKNGIRNAAQTTVAPTGTIATVAGCEGYGCEPVFALAYKRNMNDNGKTIELPYVSPMFAQALVDSGISPQEQLSVIETVINEGTCQCLPAAILPPAVRRVFVVSQDITPEQHVRMQASIQAFVDNSISKTCNLPEGATEEDVARAYMMAWELGCKGLTVYVTGSRKIVVLETKKEAEKKAAEQQQQQQNVLSTALSNDSDGDCSPEQGASSDEEDAAAPSPVAVASAIPARMKEQGSTSSTGLRWSIDSPDAKGRIYEGRKRSKLPPLVPGSIFCEEMPGGKHLYITIGCDPATGEPCTCFVKGGKGGSDVAAYQEAIGRLISLLVTVSPETTSTDRLEMAAETLKGIGGRMQGGGRGHDYKSSAPDAVSKACFDMVQMLRQGKAPALDEKFRKKSRNSVRAEEDAPATRRPGSGRKLDFDVCPKCDQNTLERNSGCEDCHNIECAYSKCS